MITKFRSDNKWNEGSTPGPEFRARPGGGAPGGPSYDFSEEVNKGNVDGFRDNVERHQRDMNPDDPESGFRRYDVRGHVMHRAYVRRLRNLRQLPRRCAISTRTFMTACVVSRKRQNMT